MRKRVNLKPFAASFWCLVLSNCATRPMPPDVFACHSLKSTLATDPETGHTMLKPSPTCMREVNEPDCGLCVRVVSGGAFYVGNSEGHLYKGKAWHELYEESILFPAEESYAPLAAFLMTKCGAD